MNAERWQEIDKLFEAGLEKKADEREAFLEGLDAEMRAEVANLLAADEAARTFLESRADTWVAHLAVGTEPPEPRELPRRIGPYKVLGVLGEGGMGRVLLASRADDQYQRLVAIKTLRTRLPSALREELLARFDLERQALAQLEHPNIARLYDAGRDEQGNPYLVIEHIDGMPIDHYCDEKRLDVAARLRLSLEVCQAVQSAHRNLLVHRDLKPSNILITHDGRPMLLDFGIAKLLDPARIAGNVLETRAGSRPMTPGYASPEQIKGEPITTASDVYSLGVLLYELLTGRRPYRVTSSLPHELEKAICEVEPEKPSTAVFRDETKSNTKNSFASLLPPQEVAQLRGTTVAALARTLRGDLDTLLSTALRKDPDQRYPSVEALAQDIQAFLGEKPLQARPPSRLYSLRKFALRHRFGVAAAAMLAILLLSFLTVLMVQARQIRAERDKAETALSFLVEVFKASDPSRAQGEELKAREILDGAARRVEGELAAQPEIQATLMDAMGQVYFSLGLYPEAQGLFEKALTRRGAELGPQHAETLMTRARFGRTLREQGELVAARQEAEAVISGRDPRAEEDATFAQHLADLATIDEDERKFDAAIVLRRHAVDILEATGADFRKRVEALAHLINALLQAHRFAEVDPLMAILRQQSATLMQSDSENLEMAASLFSVGDLLEQFGDSRAEPMLRRSLEIRKSLLAAEHPSVLDTEATLAFFLAYEERYDEALELFRPAYTKALAALGPNNLQTVKIENNLAMALAKSGRIGEGLPLLMDVLDRVTELNGDISMRTARAWLNVGTAQQTAGAYAEAERCYLESKKRIERLPKPDLSLVDIAFARLRRDQKQYLEADGYYEKGLETRRSLVGENDWQYAVLVAEYAEMLVELGRYEESESKALASYNTLRQFYGPQTVMLKKPLQALFALYEKQGREQEAATLKAALADASLRPEKLGP